jgi:hypothetical protein
MPYWSWLVDHYCAHWGVRLEERPAPPDLRAGLVVAGTVDGETDQEVARLRAALAAGFEDSVWFDARASGTARAALGGRIAVTFGAHPITLKKNWTEQVPYNEWVTTSEPFQEAYDETETYTEQVPYIEYRTVSQPCGDTTCTESVPETCYRSETRTRVVTRYRTAYRDTTRLETRWRDEPRVFEYQATQRPGHYVAAVRVHIDGGVPEVLATATDDTTSSGIEHDVTFAPAGVHPEHADLVGRDLYIRTEEDVLRTRFVRALDDSFRRVHCSASSYTLEEAAACAYLDPRGAPPAVRAALREELGDEEPLVVQLLAR